LNSVDGIEPVWVLNEVLEDVNNGEDLGKAFHYALDHAGIYIRVPAEHEESVREYLEALKATN